jgi:L-ascorbate metabolism protein UlaG (beta-lactamase superfamily)
MMKITKYGHACLLIEEGQARLLIDPGAYSKGFEDLTALDAILLTHQHQDHWVPENIQKLVAANPQARVLADEGSAKLLGEQGIEAQVVHHGDTLDITGVNVEVVGTDHAIIHPDIPMIANVGYLVAGKFFYPGDNFTDPDRDVEVLAVPSGAPWLKIREVVDYVRALQPGVAIPVHDAVLAIPEMNNGLLEQLTQGRGVEVRVVPNGTSTEV